MLHERTPERGVGRSNGERTPRTGVRAENEDEDKDEDAGKDEGGRGEREEQERTPR